MCLAESDTQDQSDKKNVLQVKSDQMKRSWYVKPRVSYLSD